MQQVGRYQIVSELGRGAMGIVYKALDPVIGRTIAIKSIRLRDLTDPSERDRLKERLFREAQSAGILSHPNIVTIYDIMEADGLAYIFMEFVNGPTMERLLQAPQAPDKESLLSILRQTAGALDYAHKKGIVHRDIKPANIMIHEDGAAKIADFGVAKIMSQSLTLAGTMMGTPSYMSPEQIQGADISGRTDQFALAIIAYEILTGHKPFVADHLPTLLFKIMRDRPLPPQRLNPTLGSLAGSVFEQALSKAPEERFDNCVDFIHALAAACNTNPEWIPLPRGASEDMPTLASDPGSPAPSPAPKASTTMMETVAVVAAETTRPEEQAPEITAPAPAPEPEPDLAPLAITPLLEPVPTAVAPEPAPVAIALPLPEPRRRQVRSNHTLRNLAIAALLAVLIGGGVYTLSNRPIAEPLVETPASEAITGPTPQAPPTPAATVAPNAALLPQESTFALSSTPAALNAVFDENLATACITPCEISLAAGRHTFVLRKEGYRESRRIIETPRDTVMAVDLAQMIGTLSLITDPPGLTVLIDGREQAQKTPLSVRLPAGPHRVEAVSGSDRQQITVEINDGSITARSLTWQ